MLIGGGFCLGGRRRGWRGRNGGLPAEVGAFVFRGKSWSGKHGNERLLRSGTIRGIGEDRLTQESPVGRLDSFRSCEAQDFFNVKADERIFTFAVGKAQARSLLLLHPGGTVGAV